MKRRGEITMISARLKISVVFFLYKILNSFLFLLTGLLYSSNKNPKKILVFRVGALGDSLCAIPAIVDIRNHFRAAHIDLLINGGKQNAVTMDKLLERKYFDNFINYENSDKRLVFQKIKAGKYDLVIQLPQVRAPYLFLVRDLLVFRFAGIPAGFGWQFSFMKIFKKTQEKYILFDNEANRLKLLLASNGVEIALKNAFPLNISRLDEDIVMALMKRKGVEKGRSSIAIIPGAGQKENIWKVSNFVEVAKNFSEQYNIFIIAGEKEKTLKEEFAHLSNVFSFIGELSPTQSAFLLKKCVLTVANDSGPMHLSYAVGTPVVAIFSSRDYPGKWFPPDDGINKVFRTEDMDCAICIGKSCNNNICMQQIQVAEVVAAMEVLLKRN